MSSETKRSKPVHINGNGTWNSKYGMMYRFEVEMENGDTGEYSSKYQDQNKFQVGVEVEYTIESRDYNGKTFYNIKPVLQQMNAQGFQSGGAYKGRNEETNNQIIRQTCIKVAGELAVAEKILPEQILDIASQLVVYVQTGQVKQLAVEPTKNPF